MQVYNELPLFLECMQRWKIAPTQKDFVSSYYNPLKELLQPMLEDWGMHPEDFHAATLDLDWPAYRADVLSLDCKREQARVEHHLQSVESLLGVHLQGEVVLFSAFTLMDGYARFDQGHHRVFLGVDESHAHRSYLDILISHELTHVARESQPEVWAGFGLNVGMSHDEFTDNLPVIEHLFSEGYSCVVSELLNPSEEDWHYTYQSEAGLQKVYAHGPQLDKVIHKEIQRSNGHYGRLYNTSQYGAGIPAFAHYVWAWQWVRHLLKTHAGGDPRKLLKRCAVDLVSDALAFELRAPAGER